MDLKTVSKETQATIQQIQRWIKSNSNEIFFFNKY